MSDNIVDFNDYKKRRSAEPDAMGSDMEQLMHYLESLPQSALMDRTVELIGDRMSRLLTCSDIVGQVSEIVGEFGFDPNDFIPEERSFNHFLTMDLAPGEDMMWNGPWFDWKTDEFIVRIVSSIDCVEEDNLVKPNRLVLECFRLGKDDDKWQVRNNRGQWRNDGPDDDAFDEYMDYFGEAEDYEQDMDWKYADPARNELLGLGIGYATLTALFQAGVKGIEGLAAMTEDEVLRVKGIGPKGLEKIKSALSQIGRKLKS